MTEDGNDYSVDFCKVKRWESKLIKEEKEDNKEKEYTEKEKGNRRRKQRKRDWSCLEKIRNNILLTRES